MSRIRPDLPGAGSQEEIRSLCAGALRKRADDYAPFAELKDGDDFDAYCNRVENSADWGGELELRALADEIECRILVHRAEGPTPLEIGNEYKRNGAPLQVVFTDISSRPENTTTLRYHSTTDSSASTTRNSSCCVK